MRREQHEQQADAFLGWHKKRGGALDNDFDVWASSKDLELKDYMATKTIVVEIVGVVWRRADRTALTAAGMKARQRAVEEAARRQEA